MKSELKIDFIGLFMYVFISFVYFGYLIIMNEQHIIIEFIMILLFPFGLFSLLMIAVITTAIFTNLKDNRY